MNNARINYSKATCFLALSVYFFLCIYYPATASDNWHLINNVDLVIHEAGHTLMPPFIFGEFINILGGSLFQILVPGIFAGYFYLRREILSFSVMMMWLSESLMYVSVYAGDSIKMQLPLLGGDNVIHDWNYLLSQSGLLHYTDFISVLMSICSWTLFIVAFLISLEELQKGSK